MRGKGCLGFSLLETLCVITIISTLAALSYPAFFASIKSAKRISAKSNLRQLHLAFMIYRSDYDDKPGITASLPDYLSVYVTGKPSSVLPDTEGLWMSPCGTHPDATGTNWETNLFYFASARTDEPWGAMYAIEKENSILLLDLNCTSESVPLAADYFDKIALGVTLEGRLFEKRTEKPLVSLEDYSGW